ncbi:MAG: zinc-dependent alcohol dehydrogenase family protein [Chloroflexi bacterium]|nr:zinc-dependent alcohol dehydrogenase family protein [Chloroflexota bacterium]
MKAMGFTSTAPVEESPLQLMEVPVPVPRPGHVLVKIAACGICLTDRHQIEGDLPQKYSPTIPGHQIIGRVAGIGEGASKFKVGDRVGIVWIYSACGTCAYCQRGNENLCDSARFTGWDVPGGYAEYVVVDQGFAYLIPDRFSDSQAAPLLCAGVIGYRSLRLSGVQPGQTIGLYGFGASAHIVLQVARYWGCRVYAFDRKESARKLAETLGADWTGSIEARPPRKLDAAITFAPSEDVVLWALEALDKGQRLVLNAIAMAARQEKPFSYPQQLWYEKEVKSVANVTRQDVLKFLPLAAEIPIMPEFREFPLQEANTALNLLKQGKIAGAAVLKVA